MARERSNNGSPMETVISIIGPGMTVVGDCQTDGTIRVEGSVKGSVKAGKAVVVGKDGLVEGDIVTQDAVVSGTVKGTLLAESRLELQATCHVEGEVRARRMQLEEGAILNGTVDMGGNPKATLPTTPTSDGQAVPLQAAGPAAGPVPASAHEHQPQHEHEPQRAAE
jgi:cytoskeletal protein CcmA (bactofilin family)